MTIDGVSVMAVALKDLKHWRGRRSWFCVRPRGRHMSYVAIERVERAGRYRRRVHLSDGLYYVVAPEHAVYVEGAS